MGCWLKIYSESPNSALFPIRSSLPFLEVWLENHQAQSDSITSPLLQRNYDNQDQFQSTGTYETWSQDCCTMTTRTDWLVNYTAEFESTAEGKRDQKRGVTTSKRWELWCWNVETGSNQRPQTERLWKKVGLTGSTSAGRNPSSAEVCLVNDEEEEKREEAGPGQTQPEAELKSKHQPSRLMDPPGWFQLPHLSVKTCFWFIQ